LTPRLPFAGVIFSSVLSWAACADADADAEAEASAGVCGCPLLQAAVSSPIAKAATALT
jgi:hypothetical protein